MHRSAAPRSRFRTVFAALLALLLGAAPLSHARSAPAPASAPYVEGEVLLVFQPDARPQDVRAILRDLGAARIHTSRRSHIERHRIRMPVAEAVARYRNHPAVRIIEPNYLVHADVVPNDPSFAIQWALENTGQQGGTPGADIHAVAAWDQITGSNQIVVAIVDTGMDMTHPDLAPNLYTNPAEIPGNGLDDDGNGLVDDVHGFDFANFDADPSDDNGHGTHVAGTIGSRGDNGIGVAGVVWHVRLLPLKFLDAGGTGTTADAVDCVDYAALAGATVINASWGSPEKSQALELAIQQAGDDGVLFVAAAGNTGSNNDVFGSYPASFTDANVIAVGASSRTDERATFSSYGPNGVDLFAPGVQILSTLPQGSYGLNSGTSMATPHVSGALALLKSRFPGMGAPTMKSVLLAATDRVPALAGLCVSGGRLNMARMLEGVDSTSPGPITDLASSFASSDRVTLSWTATGDDGLVGTATEYELRYALAPIDSSTFAAARRVPGTPIPRAAGAREEMSITGLAPLTDYYVALVAHDEFGNPSPLSNVVVVRTTAPPVAAVAPPSAEATLLTGQRQTAVVDVRNDGAGALDFTAQVAGASGAPPPRWLSVLPGGGSVTAGAHVPLTVTMSADGLPGGEYAGMVRLTTNDPAHSMLDVPIAMHVVSAPDLDADPPMITFGPVAVGNSDTEELFVINSGFADLRVDSVTVEGSGFSVDRGGFVLPPGQSWDLFVTASPARTGPITGAVVIASNDPDQPVTRVPLAVGGIIPPVASIAPARQDASLHTGQTTTRTFAIANSGGSSLSWSLRPRSAAALAFDSTGALVEALAPRPEPATEPWGGPAALEAASPTADVSDVRVVFDARHGASSGAWSDMVSSLTSRGAIFTVNTKRLTAAVLAGVDVYWISDDAGAFGADERAALAAWVRSGGSVLLEGAAPSALPEFDALLDSTGVPLRYEPNQGITGPTERIYPFEITRDVAATDMPSSTARLHVEGPGATVLVEDAQGFTTLAASFVERGRVLAAAGRLFADVSAIFADNRKLASQAFGWLGGAAWLSVSPGSGTTGPGQSSTVTVTFDAARMAGALYRGAFAVRTNDPDRSDFVVPADLSVTPAADASATPASLGFGSVFVGASRRDSVRVQNVGVLPLFVRSATADHPDFAVSIDSLTLAPGAWVTVLVTYAPAAVGPASATLTLRTDDPDEPEIGIAMTAAAIPAPDVDLVAAPVSAALPTGGTADRSITVANRAGSDLQYAIHFEEDAPLSSAAAAAGATRADAFPRTWAEARESARSLQGRVVAPRPAFAGATAASSDSLPLVVIDPRGDGSVVDLVVARAWARGGILSVRLETATDIIPLNFGGYLSLDLDQNRNTGRAPSFGTPRQDIGAEFEVSLFSVGYGVVDLLDALTGNYVESFPVDVGARSIDFAIPLSWLRGDDGRINATGVIGNFIGATDWFPDRGHGTVGGLWLATAPGRGTLAAGSEALIALTLDALALPGGAYRGRIVVESNDPDEPVLEVPASLDVTDAPVATVTATTLHLGNVFLGASAEGEIVVGNQGTAPLDVTSVTSDLSDFAATPASFRVAPGATQTVRLTFTPVAEGPREGTLTIGHDATGGPILVSLTGAGLVAPVVQVAPASLTSTLGLGEKGAASLTIRNAGGSVLSYGVEPLNGAPAAVQEGLALARDEEDPRAGIAPPGALGIGGPDGFGYRWVDSNQPGGPVFDWQDIEAIGTPVPIRNLDQNSGPLPIGFPFSFYGHDYTTFNVCTHGWISFTDTTVQFANQPLPTTLAPANALAVFWDDLNFGGVERAVTYNDGTRLIVQFTNVPRRQRGGPFTFQVILYPTGAIVYQYLLMGPPLDSGTIGIQNRTKTDGLTVVFNSAYLHDRMAVRFSAAPSWLGVPRRFGSVDPGDSATVDVALDSRGLFAGDYDGILRVQADDPARLETLVPVRLHVAGVPRLAFSPAALRFDTLDVGQAATDTLRVTNDGTDRLEASIAFDRPDYAADPASLSLAPLQSGSVLVRFQPVSGGDRSGILTLTTNDPAAPATPVPVTAAARLSLRQLPAEIVPAVLRRGSHGREVRARIVFPADLDARSVDLAAIRLQGSVPPLLGASRLPDLDGDGLPDLDLAFDRGAVVGVLPLGDAVAVSITGRTGSGVRFEARGRVRVSGTALAAPGVEFDEDVVPTVSAIRPSAPNPFTASTALRFDLAGGGSAALRVYSAGGRLVRTLFRSPLPAGRFRAPWDGRDDRGTPLPSGVYFARLEVAGASPYSGVQRVVRVR